MPVIELDLRKARKIDFTNTVPGFQSFDSCGDEVLRLVRHAGAETVIAIDRGYEIEAPHLVTDHLNLTGHNPLVGPNDPCGERFPSVNDIYVTDILPELPRGVAAGLKPGVQPSPEDLKVIKSLGADFYCYNLVPTMIVAAHARLRVLGIVVPENWAGEVSLLSFLTGGGK